MCHRILNLIKSVELIFVSKDSFISYVFQLTSYNTVETLHYILFTNYTHFIDHKLPRIKKEITTNDST